MLSADERRLGPEELADQGSRAASALFAMGLTAGDTVALLLRNDFPYFIMHEAARYGPFDMVPVNWHLKVDELEYLLRDCRAKTLIIHADLLSEALCGRLSDLSVVVVPTPAAFIEAYHLPVSDPVLRSAFIDWQDWLNNSTACDRQPLPFYPPRFYTSGSSGRPKAVIRGQIPADAAASMAARTASAWGFTKTPIRSVMTGPLYHSAPNGYANMVLHYGGSLVLQPRFDAEALLQLIEAEKITHLHMVPTMFSRLLALPDAVRDRYRLSSLVHVSHGAAPCPVEVKRKMIEWWGPVIHEYYAMTETGIITGSSSEEWLAHPGSVGRAGPGVSLQIRDNENGESCAPREHGLICVQHEATADVSYQDPGSQVELVENGYLVTGDIGYLDGDGFLYLSDRKSDMVISGGVNIYPAEIEKVLINFDGIRDCVVFGIPDEEFGESLVALVESHEQLDTSTITAYLKERIAGFKVPRHIALVDKLPREDSGKIKKRELRENYLNAVAGK